MKAYIDLLGATARKTTIGWEYERYGMVAEIGDDEFPSQSEKVRAAILAIADLTGDVGTPYPEDPAAILREFRADSESAEEVRVVAVYRTTGGNIPGDVATVEIGTQLSQTETNKDVNGNAVFVSYTYPAGYTLNPARAGTTVEQGGMLQKLVPESTIVARRVEYVSPGAQSRQYVGKVNSGGWSLDPSAAPRTWMVISITGRSNDGGFTWETERVFAYRADTWDETVVFINPDDGRPPRDLVSGVGIKTVQKHPTINFNVFGLP